MEFKLGLMVCPFSRKFKLLTLILLFTYPYTFKGWKVSTLSTLVKIFSRLNIFLKFPRKQNLAFHANCLQWNVKSCFLGKIRRGPRRPCIAHLIIRQAKTEKRTDDRPSDMVLKKKNFKGILLYMSMVAILVM